MKHRLFAVIVLILALGAGAARARQPDSQDPFSALLGGIFTLPLQITYTLFSPTEKEDLNTAYRRRGFSQKDQDYGQLNWYHEQRQGYSDLFERKELEEEIERETYGPFRDR